MRIKKEFKVREMAGEHVIIMHGKDGADMTKVIALNSSSLLLWEKLSGEEFDVEDVKNTILENYAGEVDEDTARHDSEEWIKKLEECGLVEQ